MVYKLQANENLRSDLLFFDIVSISFCVCASLVFRFTQLILLSLFLSLSLSNSSIEMCGEV